MNEEIKNLIQNIPNDTELGRRIRALYHMLYGNSNSPFGSQYTSTTTQEGFITNKKTLLNG